MNIKPIPAGQAQTELSAPLLAVSLECGFPSPAEDYKECDLDLNEHLIQSPACTFFARANGDSLSGHGIHSGDLLIVNRSAPRVNGSVVVVAIDGQFTCKVLDLKNRSLCSSNDSYAPIPITDDVDLVIEGVVTHAVHYLVP